MEPARIPPPSSTGRGALWLVFAFALLLRIGFAGYRALQAADPLAFDLPDERDYWSIAQNIHTGRGLIDPLGLRAGRMPLYPAFLSLFAGFEYGVLYAKALQCALGALAAVAMTALTARIAGRRAGIIAGFIVAVDPFLVFFSSLLLTETLFTTALTALWLAGIATNKDRVEIGNRKSVARWLLIGLLASLCVYLRESSLLLVIVWIVYLAIWRDRLHARSQSAIRNPQSAIGNPAAAGELRLELLGPLVALAVVPLALLPWAIRNARATGDFCWLTHRGGVSLYDGVGPQATGKSDLAEVYRIPAVQGLSEVEWDRYFRRAAWEQIRTDPARVARLAVRKIVRTWSPVPNADEYRSRLIRAVSGGWTIPTWSLALGGVWALRRRPGLVFALLMPALYFTAVHAIFVGSVRYRLPAMALISALGASACDVVWVKARRRAAVRTPPAKAG